MDPEEGCGGGRQGCGGQVESEREGSYGEAQGSDNIGQEVGDAFKR